MVHLGWLLTDKAGELFEKTSISVDVGVGSGVHFLSLFGV